MTPQGLGITAPFPSEFPRTTAPNANYVYAPDSLQYGVGQTPSITPQGPPPKRRKRAPSKAPSRDAPIDILPRTEAVRHMERERQRRQSSPAQHLLPRAPGRGRRDPQAEEEDAYVEGLRRQNLAWKVVRDKFRERFNKDASEARLQMRLLRRRKGRLVRWNDHDVSI